MHSAIRKLLMVLIGADFCELGNINVCNSVFLDESVQSIRDGLEFSAEALKLPNGVDNGVLDEHNITDCSNELTAAAAIVLTALSVNLICSVRETIQVQIPQLVLVHFHLVDMVSRFA